MWQPRLFFFSSEGHILHSSHQKIAPSGHLKRNTHHAIPNTTTVPKDSTTAILITQYALQIRPPYFINDAHCGLRLPSVVPKGRSRDHNRQNSVAVHPPTVALSARAKDCINCLLWSSLATVLRTATVARGGLQPYPAKPCPHSYGDCTHLSDGLSYSMN
jgi:hypothetical protein